MKTILKISAVLYFVLQHNIYSQQLVQNLSELYKLKDNEQLFTNRPLKDLFKEIKPEIKTGSVINEKHSFLFCFRFTSIEEQKRKEGSLNQRASLLVHVSEHIPWYWIYRPKGNEIIWTQRDLYEYGDMIVTHVDIITAGEEA
ncbi:hypothetical protein [Flavobacterium sp. 2]|uniref:hypothetical protein n=1 Tax=Flavobacterium sp. 2 TaxID=308053 RepID=UPI003CE7ACE0